MKTSIVVGSVVLILCGVFTGGYYAGLNVEREVCAPCDDMGFVGTGEYDSGTIPASKTSLLFPNSFVYNIKFAMRAPLEYEQRETVVAEIPCNISCETSIIGITWPDISNVKKVILCNNVLDLAAWHPRDIIIRECKETCKTECKREE